MKQAILLFTAAFIVFSFSAAAQNRRSTQERLKMLNDRLNLTEEQSVKIEKILKAADEGIQKLRESQSPDRTEFRKVMDHTNQEILNILNENQKAEYNKMLEERRNRWRKNSDDGNK